MRYEIFGYQINRNVSISIFEEVINTIDIKKIRKFWNTFERSH